MNHTKFSHEIKKNKRKVESHVKQKNKNKVEYLKDMVLKREMSI